MLKTISVMIDLEQKASLALRNVLIEMPHLAGLAAGVRLQLDERVQTAGVFASGRMLFNPGWLEKLTLPAATFVMAHELMHLMLMTHERAGASNPQLVNVAHDIIINWMLEKELDVRVPANGLTYKKVIQHPSWYRFENEASASLEEVVALLQTNGLPDKIKNAACWSLGVVEPDGAGQGTALGGALRLALGQPKPTNTAQAPTQMTDVFTEADEQRLFPEEKPADLERQVAEVRRLSIAAVSSRHIHLKLEGITPMNSRGGGNREQNLHYRALQQYFQPPWEAALQQWMEATLLTRRSYARPSRRGTNLPDGVVLPGKERFGHTLHLVLDVSGSQIYIQPVVLGKVHAFCEAMEVEQVHIIQCGTHITKDEWVDTADLKEYAIVGTGGGDMRPAMERLADDPQVECAIVVTDGCEAIPKNPVPYEVLWVLTIHNSYFQPGYGRVIEVEG